MFTVAARSRRKEKVVPLWCELAVRPLKGVEVPPTANVE
jgi:hypothetical protein